MLRSGRRIRRWLVIAVVLAAGVGFATPTADACMRCSLGLCINAAADGYSGCQEVVIIVGYFPIYTCNLTGSCQWEGEGGGGPCGCEPDQKN